MTFPNKLILTENHFFRHRRHYPIATRLAIAADLGYDGYDTPQSRAPGDGALTR